MPQVNLSALSAAELRRTLDSSRARGDATLAYEVLREMAARREAREARRPLARRRAGAPHLVSVDLSDPMDRQDEFDESVETAEPLSLHLPDPAPAAPTDDEDWTLNLRRDEMPSRPAPAKRSFRGTVGFVLGIACGVGIGWWAAGAVQLPALPALPGGPAPAMAAAPAVETPAAPPGLEVSVAEAEAAPATEPQAAAPVVAPDPAPEPRAEPEAAAPVDLAEAPAAASACAAEPTPADRAICGDPALQTLQQELRTAYAEALDAHEDKGLLRQRQLAWADARNGVADAERLAGLYRERIERLRSATAAARAAR